MFLLNSFILLQLLKASGREFTVSLHLDTRKSEEHKLLLLAWGVTGCYYPVGCLQSEEQTCLSCKPVPSVMLRI